LEEVKHLKDVFPMVVLAWEHSNSLVLVRLHQVALGVRVAKPVCLLLLEVATS
jgi:hypothetical protein